MVTLVNIARSRLCTHMDIQEALRRSSLYNPDIGKRISARCISAVPEAAAELQRNARTAPTSASTHMRRNAQRRQKSCIDFDGRRCRCCPQLLVPGGRSKHRW